MKHRILITLVCASVAQTSVAAETLTAAEKDSVPSLPTIQIDGASTPDIVSENGVVRFDPGNPAYTSSAVDGASILGNVPGMSVVRKGQQSGDPVFRGLGGSRLLITANDQFMYGGCGIRMDSPSVYINPLAYDEVIITKGPQSVTKGGGLVAGAVEFVRAPLKFDAPGIRLNTSISAGSNEYYAGNADFAVGNQVIAFRAILDKNQAENYKDGNGNEIPSWYRRRSGSFNLALTPHDKLRIDLFAETLRSKAAYSNLYYLKEASFTDRDAKGIKITLHEPIPVVDNLSLEYGRSHQDVAVHFVFPNGTQSGGNPNRIIHNGKLSADLNLVANGLTTVGMDWYRDRFQHRTNPRLVQMANRLDSKGKNTGYFIEHRQTLDPHNALIAGIRRDETNFRTYDGGWYTPGLEKDYGATSGFIRYENSQTVFKNYIGLGYASRIPDIWERNRSNFEARPEKSLQLDIGTQIATPQYTFYADAFLNRIDDYLLQRQANPDVHDLAGQYSILNVDALRYGFELGGRYTLPRNLYLNGSLAYTWAKNKTDGTPLGQTPPLNGTLGIGYDDGKYSALLNLNFAARQHRVSIGDGSISGVDTRKTPGHATLDFSSQVKFTKDLELTVGIDNLLDRQYHEHVSKTMYIEEFLQYYPEYRGLQTPEPGRRIWATLNWRYD